MLSQARYHEKVPTDHVKNLLFRYELNRRCEESDTARRDVLIACRDDFLFYLRAFAWQFNPDIVGTEINTFIPWQWQEDAMLRTMQRLYQDRRSVVWEKSRKMGATWMALYMFDWASRFHEMKKFLVMSHTQDAVDRLGDMDSLFERVSFINKLLPPWMYQGFNRKRLILTYKNGSAVTGVATTQRSGVGGRATSILNDEFSKYRDAAKILGQLKDVGPSLYIGTHYGVGGEFYKLCERPDQFKIVMHWSMHPTFRKGLYKYNPSLPGNLELLDGGYQFPQGYKFVLDGTPTGGPHPGVRSPWYDAECVDRGNRRDVAMHLDIDPAGSSHQFFDPIAIRDHIRRYSREPVWRGEFDYDSASGRLQGIKADARGRLKLWVNPDGAGNLPPSKYTAGADISAGTGNTPSTFCGIDASRGIKILEWQDSRIDPKDYGPLAVALCWLMKDAAGQGARFCWESDGPVGFKFGQEVTKRGYTNIYMRADEFKLLSGQSENPGWYSQQRGAKYSLLSDYRKALEKGDLVNPCESSLMETLNFIVTPDQEVVHNESITTDDPTAARSNHGDQVIADALAWKMAKDIARLKVLEMEKQDVPVFSVDWFARQMESQRARSWA
jgi:hypothetical protein